MEKISVNNFVRGGKDQIEQPNRRTLQKEEGKEKRKRGQRRKTRSMFLFSSDPRMERISHGTNDQKKMTPRLTNGARGGGEEPEMKRTLKNPVTSSSNKERAGTNGIKKTDMGA